MTKSGGKEFLLLLVALLITLAVAEAVVRHWFPPDEVGVLYSTKGDNIESLYYKTPDGIRMQPNARLDVLRDARYQRTYSIQTNSLGLRNAELGEKTRPRILFLGDSVTAGWAVNENETFARKVEGLAQAAGKNVEVVNAGIPGLSTFNEIALLKTLLPKVQPDVVVLDYYLNDATACCIRPVQLPPLPYSKSWLVQLLFRNVHLWLTRDYKYSDIPEPTLEEWRRELRARFPGDADAAETTAAGFHSRILADVTDWGNAWTKDAWEEMRAALIELSNLAEENNFQVLLVGFTNVPQILAPKSEVYPQQELTRLARELSLPFLNLLPLIREPAKHAPEPFFVDHCHLAPYGHSFIAKLIWEFLESHQNPALQTAPMAADAPTSQP